MKKIFMMIAMLACITTASAQWNIGGTVGFTTTKIDAGGSDQSGSSYKIVPDIGYSINENLIVGVQLGYSSGMAAFGSLTVTDIKSAISTLAGAASDIGNDSYKLNSFTISPYIRYKLVEYGKASVAVEGYLGYNSISSDGSPTVQSSDGGSYGGNELTFNAFEIGLRPVATFQVSDKLDILCKLGAVGFMSAKEKESDIKITRFGVNVDSYNILFGLNFHF